MKDAIYLWAMRGLHLMTFDAVIYKYADVVPYYSQSHRDEDTLFINTVGISTPRLYQYSRCPQMLAMKSHLSQQLFWSINISWAPIIAWMQSYRIWWLIRALITACVSRATRHIGAIETYCLTIKPRRYLPLSIMMIEDELVYFIYIEYWRQGEWRMRNFFSTNYFRSCRLSTRRGNKWYYIFILYFTQR